ncbi:hypothetical protein [Sphingosinicella terrae]|uniref:hypothetical protein n=1 Tax=Sphingosinicella terrae TaxID=2172047 RepID=UPI000E0D464A|nr:hypothetical protein [Sphingosinicella terrae]
MSKLRADRTYYREEATAFIVHALVLVLFVGGMVWLALNVRHSENLWIYYLVGGLCAICSGVRAVQMLSRAARSSRTPRRPASAGKTRDRLSADHRGWKDRMAESRSASRSTSKIDPDSPLARSWAKEEQQRHLEEVRRRGLSHRHSRH